ncbi:hypothetical protein Tco_0000418 [Tanacetum coccineum]
MVSENDPGNHGKDRPYQARIQAASGSTKSNADLKRSQWSWEFGEYVNLFKVLAKWKLPAGWNFIKSYAEEFTLTISSSLVEKPIEIMEREIKRLKRSWIPLVKVRWNSRRGPEFTWEREDSFKQKYPQLLFAKPSLRHPLQGIKALRTKHI